MSVSVNEINYLIWRYFQESGLEVSAYALDDETTINKLDSTYSQYVPLGCLVDLIQKGILYSKMTDLVSSTKADSIIQDDIINLNLNFFTALHQINSNDSINERKILNLNSSNNNNIDNINGKDEVLNSGNSQLLSNNNKGNDIVIKNEDKSKDESVTATNNNDNQLVTESENDDKSDFIKILKKLMNYDPSYSVSFSPINNNLIAWTQRNHKSIIYSLDSKNKIELQLPLSCKETLLISWSPNGNNLITASENGELRYWSIDGILINTLAMHHWPIVSINWSPNGNYILSLDIRNVAIVWDVNSGNVLSHLDKETWSHVNKNISDLININNDNNNNNNTNTNTNTTINPTNNSDNLTKDFENKNYGTDTCWLDDNKFVIPGPKYTLLVCQITTDSANSIIGILTGHDDSICCIKYDPKLRLLCSASEDGIIRIWKGNSTNSLQILIGHSLAVSMLEFINLSDKWYLLSTSIDGTIRIWDFFENEIVCLTSVDEGQAILCSSLYENNELSYKLIATGDSSGSICIWKILNDNNIIKIRQIGLYQNFNEDNEKNKIEDIGYVSEISWNNNGSKLAVSFSIGKSVIIDIP